MNRIILWAAFLLIVVLCPMTHAQGTSQSSRPQLKVYVTPFEESVKQRPDGSYTGAEVELWRRMAEKAGYESVFESIKTAKAVREAVEAAAARGEKDQVVGFGAVTVTAEREKVLDFVYPTLPSSYSMAVRAEIQVTPWKSLVNFVLQYWYLYVYYYLGVVIFLAVCYYFLEELPSAPQGKVAHTLLNKLGVSVWWASVSTLVGYGDVVPKRKRTKIFCVFIGFPIAIGLVAIFLATVATFRIETRAVSQIQDIKEIRGKVVVAKVGTSSIVVAKEYEPSTVLEAPNAEAAMQLVQSGKAIAFIGDEPELRSAANRITADSVIITPFRSKEYGIALGQGSNLREPLLQALLELRQSGEAEEIIKRFYGR